jgi:hypothetical protein
MTPADLRAICNSLNPGGQSKLARMIGVDPRTIRNKLSGSTPITESDALAIQKAVEKAEGRLRRARSSAQQKPQPMWAGVNLRTESFGSVNQKKLGWQTCLK